MKLYVGNLPRLAREEALQKWFAEAGYHVEAIHFIRDGQSGALYGFCFVEIRGAGIPKQALRHLSKRAFGGRPLVVQRASPEIEQGGTRALKAWFNPPPTPATATDRSKKAVLFSWSASSA